MPVLLRRKAFVVCLRCLNAIEILEKRKKLRKKFWKNGENCGKSFGKAEKIAEKVLEKWKNMVETIWKSI